MLRLIIGLLLVVLPFAGIFWLLRSAKRNRGSQHGGGLRRYFNLRNGRP